MNLRIKILTIFLSVIVVVSGVLVWAAYSSQAHIEERYASTTLQGRSLVWRSVVMDTIEGLSSTVSKMTRDRSLKDALAKGDREKLAAQIGPIYSMLAAQGMVDRVAAFDGNGKYLAMQGQETMPERPNAAVAQAIASGKVETGLVLTDDGVLMAVVATPLSKRGQTIGGGTLMRSLQWAVNQFTRRSEAQAGLYLGSQLQWGSEEFLPGLVNEPDQLDEFAIIDHEDRSYVVTRHDVKDVNGKLVATLVVSKDFTDSIHDQRLHNRFALIASVIVLAVALLLSYLFLTRALRPLHSLGDAMSRISSGDLSVDISFSSSGEIGRLEAAANRMVVDLRELLLQIHRMSDLVVERAVTMTQMAHKGLASVESQREQMGRLTASVDRMENTSRTVEEQAVGASVRTQEIDGEVVASRRVVESSTKETHKLADHIDASALVVGRVRDSSDRIKAFLAIIQDVAEQTNLLALNAAIEAARAGETGRGFAVVAEEVRNLSQRTTKNTTEIQSVIEELQRISEEACRSMEESVSIARQNVGNTRQTNDSLANIVSSVEEIRKMSSGIATIAGQQHQMSGEMLDYVSAVNASTEDAESQTHEVVSNCDKLVEIATELRAMVGRFQF